MPIINDEFLSDLKHLINNKEQGYVFCYGNNKGLKLRIINKIVQQAGERAGVTNLNPTRKHINPHLFRHSISRYLKNKHFSTEFIQNFLGHASFKTTMDMYGKMPIDEMQK